MTVAVILTLAAYAVLLWSIRNDIKKLIDEKDKQ